MKLPDKVKEKLQALPDKPGVYFMRNRQGKIIYVGKAASLRKRVQSYFRKATLRSGDIKLKGLVRSIHDLDILVTRTEAEATLTEGQMIKDYRPRYNILLKDDKRFLLLRIDVNNPFPRIKACRIRKDDDALYFGPYASSQAAWAALEFVEKRFGLRQCRPSIPGPDDHKHCLNDIIRYCSAPCIGNIDREAYHAKVLEAASFLRGEKPAILEELRQAMEKESELMHFEKAAALRDTYFLLKRAIKERVRIRKTPDMKAEDGLAGIKRLQEALHLSELPHLIEGYDISNISGTHAVASQVCSKDGLPHKKNYRMYRIKTVPGIDDPGMMAEVIRRRFSRGLKEHQTLPDLVIVDGGITQLRAAKAELGKLGLSDLPIAGLAKRFEEIYQEKDNNVSTLRLPTDSQALKILQQLRDEAHRFALTYHRKLRTQRLKESILDDIPNIGKKRKELLLRHFGSIARLRRASVKTIASIAGIGPVMAGQIKEHLK